MIFELFCGATWWKPRGFKKSSQSRIFFVDSRKPYAYNADIERGGAVASGG
jgi:hypothetical protein